MLILFYLILVLIIWLSFRWDTRKDVDIRFDISDNEYRLNFLSEKKSILESEINKSQNNKKYKKALVKLNKKVIAIEKLIIKDEKTLKDPTRF